MPNTPYDPDFLWGASTAAHQVEGGTHNQWTRWEDTHAAQLAATAAKRLSWLPKWPVISQRAMQPDNYRSANGVDHYHRYADDFTILTQLRCNSFRFGIEWSRIEPSPGEWDTAALDHYVQYVDALLARGITPVLTLWHWTVPEWFADRGGFAKGENLVHFARFTQKVADVLGPKIPYTLTLNEPNVYTGMSYAAGNWPPQAKNPLRAIVVYRNLVAAHCQAYAILKKANPQMQVGMAAHLADIRPADRNPLTLLGVGLKRYFWNWWFLDRTRQHQDFIGLNYYFTEYQAWNGMLRNPKTPLSDLGWYMEPSGIERILLQTWQRYHTPIIITENGVADSQDSQRMWWLQQTMAALERTQQRGVQLKGYLHWSLLDNFEWAYGWWPQFGLVQVDRTTMRRTIRPSARWYADYIKRQHNGHS